MSLAILLTMAAALPQGQGATGELAWSDRRTLTYPVEAKADRVLPFGDGALPATATYASAGLVELDGDGVPDAFFLGAEGMTQGKLSLLHGKNAAPGRFREFAYGPVASVVDASWVAATRYRSTWYGARERVLLVSRSADKLAQVFFQRSNPNDPTQGSIVLDPAGWTIPLGTYEIQARDGDRNGHDDVVLLTQTPGGTEVRKLVIGAPNYYLTPTSEVTGQIPAALSMLRCMDLDGDRRDDVVAWAPGLGIVGFRDDGQRNFVPALFVPLPAGLVDLQVGDLDGDGREDLALCTTQYVAALLRRAAGDVVLTGTRVAGTAALRTVQILDGDGDAKADLIALSEDGRAVTVYGYDGKAASFAPPRVLTPAPSQLPDYPQTPVLGQALLTGDVDNDGDQDALIQVGGGKSWVLLRSPTWQLAPREVPVVHVGPISAGSTLLKEQLGVRLPPEWNVDLWDQLEIGYYMQDAVDKTRFFLRATQIVTLDGSRTQIDFPVWYERDPAKHGIVQNANPLYLGLPYLAGDVVVFVHGKHSESVYAARPPRRFESLVLHHKAGGDGQTSNGGVKWSASKAPPLLKTDEVLLPWQ